MSANDPPAFSGKITGSISTTPAQRAGRRGSFSASLSASHGNQLVGKMEITHSASQRTTTISSIQNTSGGRVKGVGSALMQRAEHVARQMGDHTLETTLTAPSAQGFYKKQGLRPNPELFSALKKAAPEVSDDVLASKVPIWGKSLG